MPSFSEVRKALTALSSHPHDHGWHPLYDLLRRQMDEEQGHGGGPITRIIDACNLHRSSSSASHAATLLCIAIKSTATDYDWHRLPIFQSGPSVTKKSECLRGIISTHERLLLERVLSKQNSFSSVRRFLAPQVVVSHFARARNIPIRLVDLGTGPGLLPRQLGNRRTYERFAPDLSWTGWQPEFLEIPFETRWGVDLPSSGDLDWVHHSYGPSTYYDKQFEELIGVLQEPDIQTTELESAELDIVDTDRLSAFLGEHRFNVATCSFVLYQYSSKVRARIIDAVVDSIDPDGIFISVEPNADLLEAGCRVRIYQARQHTPVDFAHVESGHFIGTATPGKDFYDFLRRFLGVSNSLALTE